MAGRISDYQAHMWLDSLTDPTWFSLHHENPEVGGAYASELIGGGYARQPSVTTAANARATFTVVPVMFTGLPAVVVSHVGAWDERYRGNLIAFFELPEPVFVVSGGSLSFAAGDIAISID